MAVSSTRIKKLAYIAVSIVLFFFILRTLTQEVNGSTAENEVFAPPARNSNKDTVHAPDNKDDDPDLVDTWPAYDPAPAVQGYLSQVPVLIFSKTTCSFSQKVKELFINKIKVNPLPAVYEVDNDAHPAEMMKYLEKISGHKTVPNVFVDGVSIGGYDDMIAMGDDKLVDKLNELGNGKIIAEKY